MKHVVLLIPNSYNNGNERKKADSDSDSQGDRGNVVKDTACMGKDRAEDQSFKGSPKAYQ